MTLAPSPPGWHAGRKWCFVKRKWLSSGLNLPAPEPVFLPPDVTVPSTAWSVLEHEGGIAATLSRRQSTSIPADVVWRSFSPLPLVASFVLNTKRRSQLAFQSITAWVRWSPNPFTCLTPRRVTSAAVSIPKDRNAALRAGPTPGIEATSIKNPSRNFCFCRSLAVS